MIWVTRLNGTEMVINSDLVESIESTPDTIITLLNGDTLIVRESVEDVVARAIDYARRAGDQAEVAQRIDGIDRRAEAIPALHRLLQEGSGAGVVALRPGDRAEVEKRHGENVIGPGFPSMGLDRRKERRGFVILPVADVDAAK